MPSELYKCNLCGKVYDVLNQAVKCETSHITFDLQRTDALLRVKCSGYAPGECFPKNITVHDNENGEIYAEYYLDEEER